MPYPESAPAFQRPRERFVKVPTHLPGVSLRAEPSVELDILRKTIEELASLAEGYTQRKFRIDELTSQQKGPGEEIKTLAQTHEGLRGVQSEEGNFVLTVFPRHRIIWDHRLLQESTGIAYSSVVYQELVVSISVPLGFQTEKGPIEDQLLRQVLTQALIDLGLEESDLQKIMAVDVARRVDEETLEKLIESGRVTLLEGTKLPDTTWAITVAPLRKSPES